MKGVATVDNNLTKFTRRQVDEAKAVHKFQDTAGLTTKAVLRMIDSGTLLNSPITRKSVRNGLAIWGPSTVNLKRKNHKD